MSVLNESRLRFKERDLAGRAESIIESDGYSLIVDVPADALEFVRLLEKWGTPLEYYGKGTVGQHPEHPAIHQVRFDPVAAERGELHALQGPLGLHSAQTMRDPRPRFFSMLMVDPGWSDVPGSNGESIIAPWSESLSLVRNTVGETRFKHLLGELMNPQPLPDGGEITIAYRLEGQRSELDLGVRMKYGLVAFWEQHEDVNPLASEALRLLGTSAARSALEVQLKAGELILLDNDRWAHGRREVRGTRPSADGQELNPRELWSVTLA